jgi:chromosome transmission fidelity protein 18
MLSASSPIGFPYSPPTTKRSKPHDHDAPKPKVRGPFLVEDDDSDSDDNEEPSDSTRTTKRLRTEDPREDPSETTVQAECTVVDLVDSEQNEDIPDIQIQEPVRLSHRPIFSSSVFGSFVPQTFTAKACNGKAKTIKERKTASAPTYEAMVAARSKTKEGRAKRSYYGIDIHNLMNAASAEIKSKEKAPKEHNIPVRSIEPQVPGGKKHKRTLLWTEKYRARNFMDLCGDDATNRKVLRWLKKWDPVVFPGESKSRPVVSRRPGAKQQEEEEKPHRKILMLTGPPGLGKTTWHMFVLDKQGTRLWRLMPAMTEVVTLSRIVFVQAWEQKASRQSAIARMAMGPKNWLSQLVLWWMKWTELSRAQGAQVKVALSRH